MGEAMAVPIKWAGFVDLSWLEVEVWASLKLATDRAAVASG